ncbi:heavy-metal-associated domain-containing protein [Lutibacter sp.]|uniref:heavy-metal-associated domain-containing protein n=1 Tax=Lutibacter sp. TaxID=1925666 RepID=UPI0034A08873
MKKLIVLLFIFAAFSCNETKKTSLDTKIDAEKAEVAANYKSVEVEIEGMTCEIGCARLIQSKMSKVDGITYTKVDFESKKGLFTFDSNKLNKEAITEKISKIAGGDLYSVSKTTEIDLIVKETSENKDIIE